MMVARGQGGEGNGEIKVKVSITGINSGSNVQRGDYSS